MSKITDGNKITIKKEIEFKPNFNSFLAVFLIFLIIFNVGAAIFLISSHLEDTAQIEALEEKVQALESGNKNVQGAQAANDYYRELSDKTDSAIDRILTVVGIIAAIVALFGILLAFKAPGDIEKRLDELNELTTKAQDAAKDAKYQARIMEALNVDYDGEITNPKRIKKLTEIIKKYPTKTDAYMHRAFIYDQMADKEYGDKKKVFINLAIADYNVAYNLGEDASSHYNDVATAYYKLGEYDKAILYLTKAIKEDADEENLRNRAVVYENIAEKQFDLNDRTNYYKLAESDLIRACEINPEEELYKSELNDIRNKIRELDKASEEKESQPVE